MMATPQEIDPLGVLSSTRSVVDEARFVRIDRAAVERVARSLDSTHALSPEWDNELHFSDGTWRTAGWVLSLDALNFCFWSADPRRRWRVDYQGDLYDGYWALVASLRRAVDEGIDLWDPQRLMVLTEHDAAHIFRPATDVAAPIPLLPERVANLNELGRGLVDLGGANPVDQLINSAQQSAVRLVQEMARRFPSFNDVAHCFGREIRFYKRAQILVADLRGAFEGKGLGQFDDLPILTAFADYKVPQVLRRLGVLVYTEELSRKLDSWDIIPAGSEEETEIRSSTVWGVELIRQALEVSGRAVSAYEIDWMLWEAGQVHCEEDRPYHRTETIFY